VAIKQGKTEFLKAYKTKKKKEEKLHGLIEPVQERYWNIQVTVCAP
jgi:hypothetical protein